MNEPVIPPPSTEVPMDEFPVKSQSKPVVTTTTRPTSGHHTKLLLIVTGGALITLIAVILIVSQAVTLTANPIASVTPTPLPIVATNAPTAKPVSDLPQDWQDARSSLESFQKSLQQPSEDRSKLSTPNMNLATTLQE